MKLNQKDAPKIEFPCDNYVIKVVGDNQPAFKPFVAEVLAKYDPRVSEASFRDNPSKNGRFISLTVRMRIEQEAQLGALYEALKQSSMVKMVL